jgi:hypothetical protein
VDFRDSWALGHSDTTAYTIIDRLLGPKFERDVIRKAQLVLFNTERARSAADALFPAHSSRTAALPNGYDPLPSIARPDSNRFRVVFSGWLYPFMDIRPVFVGCRRLLARGLLSPDELSIEFMGCDHAYGGSTLEAVAGMYGLEKSFTLHPRAARDEALRLQQAASILLVFDYPHTLAVPTKFYDHAQLYGTMLLVGNPKGALADAARAVELPVFAPFDTLGIEGWLETAVHRWRGTGFVDQADKNGIFDRKHQSRRLIEMLEALPAAPGSFMKSGWE